MVRLYTRFYILYKRKGCWIEGQKLIREERTPETLSLTKLHSYS